MRIGEKMESYYEKLGKMLRLFRKELGYYQETVAKNLGIGRSTYSDFERAKIRPHIIDLFRLAEMYHVPPEVFLHPEEYQDPRAVRSLIRNVRR